MTEPTAFRIRAAEGADLARLAPIEARAAQRFLESPHPQMATFPLFDAGELAAMVDAGEVLVATDEDDTPIGFAVVGRLGSEAYLHEIDVEPSWSRRGVGRALLGAVAEHARARGHDTLLLSTFSDVPWNAPFYARLGFVAVTPAPDEAAFVALSERERLSGLPMASRVIMRARLDAGALARSRREEGSG